LIEYITKTFDEVDDSPIVKFIEVVDRTVDITKAVISFPAVQELLKSDQEFDLVISEIALNEATLGKNNSDLENLFFPILCNYFTNRFFGTL
jgi:hypothetical protein